MESQSRRISDNSRRFFCRMAFLLICVLPTSTIIYIATHQPTTADWVQRIQSRLPIKVAIASVETPTPNRVILRDVNVVPSEASMFPELDGFVANEIIIDYRFTHNEVSFIHPVEIEMDSMASVLKRLIVEFDDSSLDMGRWQFSFRKIELLDSDSGINNLLLKPASVSILRGRSQDPTIPRLKVQMLARTDEGDLNSQLAIEFKKYEESNHVSVDAKECELPAKLIEKFLVGVPSISRNSRFSGEIKFNTDLAGQSSGTVIGELDQIHLDELQGVDQRLTGICNIRNLFCKIENGRIESGQLQVTSQSTIAVDRSLLDQVQPFGISLRRDIQDQRISIAQLELGITLQNGNLLFSGRKEYVRGDDGMSYADCIAFQLKGDGLEAIAICNSQQSIPLMSVARLIDGNQIGNQALQFLDHFSIPIRSASDIRNGLN